MRATDGEAAYHEGQERAFNRVLQVINEPARGAGTEQDTEAGSVLHSPNQGSAISKYVPAAFDVVRRGMQSDTDYAWSWHCNLAMSMVDAGCDHKIANEGAVRFMRTCFDVDTSPRVKELFPSSPSAMAAETEAKRRPLKCGRCCGAGRIIVDDRTNYPAFAPCGRCGGSGVVTVASPTPAPDVSPDTGTKRCFPHGNENCEKCPPVASVGDDLGLPWETREWDRRIIYGADGYEAAKCLTAKQAEYLCTAANAHAGLVAKVAELEANRKKMSAYFDNFETTTDDRIASLEAEVAVLHALCKRVVKFHVDNDLHESPSFVSEIMDALPSHDAAYGDQDAPTTKARS
jgi:hypothetical protein